jgi:3-hydroxybutyryl-CoA dehydrogenase
MGRGIAQLLALHGFSVVLVDRDSSILRMAMERVLERTDPGMRAGVEGRIAVSVIPERLKACDMVIEAVYEDEKTKREIFALIDTICRKNVVIASNTSAISISRLGGSLPDPARFIGCTS